MKRSCSENNRREGLLKEMRMKKRTKAKADQTRATCRGMITEVKTLKREFLKSMTIPIPSVRQRRVRRRRQRKCLTKLMLIEIVGDCLKSGNSIVMNWERVDTEREC